MEKNKSSIPRIIYILLALATAIVILSVTIGRDLYVGRTQSIQSFAFIHFSGYLFFFLMPVEMAFIYYLSFLDPARLLSVALLTAGSAQVIDYAIGYSLSTRNIRYFIGEKRIRKAEKSIQRYGALAIFVFNLLPLSSPIIALVAGMLKYRLRNLMIYSMAGLLIKYMTLSLAFMG